MKYLLKSLTSWFFSKLRGTCAAVANGSERGFPNMLRQLSTCRLLKWKIFAVRTPERSQCPLSKRRDAGHLMMLSYRSRRRKPLYAFSTSPVIALQDSSGAVTLTRDRSRRVNRAFSNYSSRLWLKVGRGHGVEESLGEMKINCPAGWVLSRPLAIWVRSEKWRAIKMHGVCYVVRRNRFCSLIRLIHGNLLVSFLVKRKKKRIAFPSVERRLNI